MNSTSRHLALGAAVVVGLLSAGCSKAPAAEPVAPGALAPADAVTAEVLFRNYCTSCHLDDGSGLANLEAPAIAGLPYWYVEKQLHGFRKGWRGGEYEDLPGLRMRPMAMTLVGDAEISLVARHIAALPSKAPASTLDGDAARGAKLYATCLACHGPDGQGIEALNSPPLTNTHDWYLVTQLKNFKAGVRGDDQGDLPGAQMMPMAAVLPDEQAMKDVVAHILTLRK